MSATAAASSNGKSRASKKSQVKYQKPTQPLYRPPSARVEGTSNESPSESQHSSNASLHSSYSSDSRFQQGFSSSFATMATNNAFPIKGVLKRSKSFGNSNRNSGEFGSSLLEDSATGRFLLSLEGLSWENLTLIKQALDRDTCASLDPCSLLKIVRILCNKVLDKPGNASMIASIAMEIHQKQQMKKTSLSDHKYLFLESLANCLREWFSERDKLRFTTGGARRWTGYLFFLMEMYLNLKSLGLASVRYQQQLERLKADDSSDESDDNCSNVDNNSADEEVSRAFSADMASDVEESSVKAEGSFLKKRPSLDIETKINNSFLAKQQKQFSNLLLDSFQVILSNPNSTPAEIECMQTAFRKCGSYLEEDNRNRIKALVFSIRDTLLNCGSASPFINANNSSNNSSITKNLLEIIELAASDWKFSQSQQIYYFPYTKMD